MATDRVGIEIELMGYKEALNNMERLDSAIHSLSGRKNYIRVQAEVDRLKMNRNALRTNKVKLQADMSQIDKEIKRLKTLLKSLEGQKPLYAKGSPALKDLETRIGRIANQIKTLESQRAPLADQFRQTKEEIQQTSAAIQQMQTALRNAGLAGKSLPQIFNGISSKVAHIGQAMQSMGNAIVRMTSPLRMITSGALLGIGYGAIGKISEGLTSGFSRYDTMKKYPQMMAEYSKASYTAEQSIKDLDLAVRGLPTGLDEIVQMSQRYTLSLGDMKKGTELAIATNNAFLASMATDSQKYQGMLQLQDLMNGKKLTSREWMSLGTSMGKAINEVGKELGYTNENMGEFRQALYGGKIDTEEFLNALVKVGTGTGKIAKMAELSKQTWEAFSANIGNAFSRMTYGVLTSLDEISKAVTGKTVNALLTDTVIPGIDKMTASIKGWIKANPDKILDFFDKIKSVDWASLGKGFIQGISDMVGIIERLAGVLDGANLSGIGRLIAWLPLIGNGLMVFGGLFKGGRHIIAGIGAGLIGIGRLVAGGGLAKIATKLGGVGKFFKGLVGLKAASTVAEGAGSVVAKKVVNLKSHFKTLAKGLSGIVAVGLGILSIGGTVFLTVKMIKSIVKDLGTISDDIGNVDADAMKKMFKWIAIIGGSIATLGTIVGGTKIGFGVAAQIEAGILAVGAIVTTISGIAWINSKLISGTIKNFLNATNSVIDIVDNINALSGAEVNTDGIDNAVEAIKTVSSALDLTTDDGLGGKKAVTPRSVKKLKQVYDNLSGIIADIKQVATDLSSLGKLNLTDAKTKATDIVNTLKSIYDTLSGSFDVVSKNDVRGTGRGETIVSNLAKIIADIKGTLDDFTALADTELDFTKSQESAEKIANNMQRLYDTINGAFAPQEQPQETGRNKTRQMGSLGYKGITRGQVGTAGRMKKMIDDISSTISTLKSVMGELTGEGGLVSLNTESLDTAISNTEEVIKGLNRISTKLGGVQASKDLASKAENLKKAVSDIKKVANALNTLGGGSLADGSSAFTAIANIKTMVQQLGEALQTDTLTDIQTKADEFKSAVDDIFNTLNQDLSNVELTVKIKGKVTGQKELIRKINNANRQVQNAVNGIRTNYTKHITLSVIANVVTHGLSGVGGAIRRQVNAAGFYSTGGYIGADGKPIYRAKGGGIGVFKPKGTDTVPAMLTHGEYVHRKQAVDFFGVEFMRRVNNLDIVGAMRELSAKAGSVVSNAKQTVINNNITNNNSPTINQNIQTNNPNFAFKRANRFVTAL